jgi:chromosome segregation ATPase
MAEERASLRGEVDRLRSETDRLRGEVDRLQGELAASGEQRSALESSALESQQRWEADLLAARAVADRHGALVSDRDAVLEATVAELERLRVEAEHAANEADRLRAAFTRLEREQQEQVQQDRAKMDQLRAELDRLRAESEQFRAEADRSTAPAAPPDWDEELRAALAQVGSLEREVAELRRHEREMDRMLGGMGLRYREV